jgi:hypothetical integral membrane protein (TIGR02206 family)
MAQYFAFDYNGAPFELFGTAHLLFLLATVAGLFSLRFLRGRSEKTLRIFRCLLIFFSVTNELAYHFWRWYYGSWTVQTMLPLHLCSVFVMINAVMLWKKSYRLYEFSIFLGVGGAMQALLTPDAGIYGLPHFRAFQTLIAHALIMAGPIYMTVVEGFRPHWRSIPRVILGANIYMLFVGVVNWVLGSNYMFIAHKPETASLIDLLGPWPWYILSLEVVGVVVCLILYLPFALNDQVQAVRGKQQAG